MNKKLCLLLLFVQIVFFTEAFLAVRGGRIFSGASRVLKSSVKKKAINVKVAIGDKKGNFPFDQTVHEICPKHMLFEEQLALYVPKFFRDIVVVIPSYNNAEYYKRNLASVFEQDYKGNFSIIYIDDHSTDGTGDLCEAYIKEKTQGHRTILIKNVKNLGAMANWYSAISSCDPQSIIVNLDGDDHLAKKSVLSLINKIYDKHDVLVTYGSYQRFPYRKKDCIYSRPIPKSIARGRAYRKMKLFTLSHLRTYKAFLFQAIKKEDFMFEGKFFDTSCDLAMMYPIAEMAGNRIMYVPDVLYIYNLATLLNDESIKRARQRQCGLFLRQRPMYPVIDIQ